ncbi:universal stress protein [Asanoa sp. NPDC050611]|uniref:universal stress protein n=1 Tax=Asanoa sp. NPDC050611 TaxID=3157098 RepID=UPI00340B426B
MDRREIVVGTDGSACATAAVRWAAEEAALRGVPLCVLSAHEPDEPAAIAEEAAARVRHDVDVRARDVTGPAVGTLLDASANAAMLVVGSRGRGGVRSLLLGSVSWQVATRADSPVAVVRGGERTGQVVVGCDGSDASRIAVETAFDLASEHHAPLLAVRAYYPPSPALGFGYQPLVYALDDRDQTMTADLADELDPWRQRHPEVDARVVVAHGGAADALVAHSRTARVVVIGSRGRGPVTSTLLGSVCPQLLHHAHCPVVVAHG